MSTAKRRVEKLESGLTPKQAILLWLQEAHAFNGIEEYVRHLKTQPDSAAPLHKLPIQVEEGVKQTLKGKPKEEIDRAVRQAYKDVLFLFFLHQRVNDKLITEQRYYGSQAMLLTSKLGSLMREQDREWQMRWNRIRVEMQMPYPLDAETAAAVEAARHNYVLTWEAIEENDDIGQWLKDSLVAKGKTLLPDGAYSMKSETKVSYTAVPTEDDVRQLFQDAESFQKFLDGKDHSYGLSDVTDAEYDAHYEAIVVAMANATKEGIVVELPTVPHQFLSEAALVDGDWIDRYAVELAEWGARIGEKGFLLQEPEDSHPMAWHRIIDPADGSIVDSARTTKLWQQTRKHLARFPGRTSLIDQRPYLNFEDYLKWRGRRNQGDFRSAIGPGMVVTQWNRWVAEHGGEGEATLAEVKVRMLDCYLDGDRYRVCQKAEELAEEVGQRESLLKSLLLGKQCGNQTRFRQQVELWKELALRFLPEIHTLRKVIDSINERYFESRGILFSSDAEGLDELLALVEKTVGIYNESLAADIERLERLLVETGDGQDESPLTIDLAGLIVNVQGTAGEQVSYLVDMAKADALELLGENRQALELVDRHV